MDLESALKLANSVVVTKTGRILRDPELTLFEGAWLGLTYEQVAESSEYSINYLMRDVGPKLWRLLSDVLGEPVNKTNIRVVLESLDQSALFAAKSPAAKLSTSEKGNLPPKNRFSGQSLQSVAQSKAAAITSHFQASTDGSVPDQIAHQGVSNLVKSSLLYGRTQELATLNQWIVQEKCRLVGIWGISGVGKTALVRTLLDQMAASSGLITWQSLNQSPTLECLIQSLPEPLSNALTESQTSAGDSVASLLATLQGQPGCLVLDEIETILQAEQTAGHFKAGYEAYGEFLQRLGEASYPGCVIVIGLEPPREFTRLESETSTVRSMVLTGLSAEDAEHVLGEERLLRSRQWSILIDYYRGHPAALRTAARIIRNLFGGSVDEFLKQQSFIFEDINALLGKSFSRLSVMEKEVLYWLASEGKPTTLSTIQQLLPLPITPTELLETLDSLKSRSLLEVHLSEGQSAFTLQPVIRDYVINQFVAQVRSSPATQDWHYRWPSRSGTHALNLTPPVQKIVNLNEWLHNRFDRDWEPVEILFTSPAKASNRLRSAFHLRGETIIKRFKQIQLQPVSQSSPVVLLVAINPEHDQTVNICVQVQPGQEESVLPPNLKLGLLDATQTTLAEVESQEADNFIQLPYFRGVTQECFSVQLWFNGASHMEKFMI